MTSSETAALRHIQDENFRLRVELIYERRCIDEGVRLIRDRLQQILDAKDATLEDAASVIEDVLKALKEPTPR